MKLALLELRRRPGRFAAATGILFLLASLLFFLGGLAEGLTGNGDGFARVQSAELFVFSETSEREIAQSIVTAAQREAIAAVDGVDEVGQLSVAQMAARVPGNDERDLVDVVVMGFELPIDGADAPPADGDGLADELSVARGIRPGDTIRIGAARTEVRVTGEVPAAGYQIRGTLWVSPATFTELVAANRPQALLPEGAAQLAVATIPEGADPAEVAERIAAEVEGVDAVTRDMIAELVPDTGGGTLRQIISMTLVIAVAVVALFFVLLTNERLGLYGVLKAIGARTRTLLLGVVVQAVVLATIALAAALVLAVVVDLVIPPGGIPFAITPANAVVSIVSLYLAAIAGAAFSLRRVVRIDPAAAIGASQ